MILFLMFSRYSMLCKELMNNNVPSWNNRKPKNGKSCAVFLREALKKQHMKYKWLVWKCTGSLLLHNKQPQNLCLKKINFLALQSMACKLSIAGMSAVLLHVFGCKWQPSSGLPRPRQSHMFGGWLELLARVPQISSMRPLQRPVQACSHGNCIPREQEWKLHSSGDLGLRCVHQSCPILLISASLKASPDSRNRKINLTSWGEKLQRICSYV